MKKLSVTLKKTEIIAGLCYLFFQLLALPTLLSWILSSITGTLTSAGMNFIFFCINFIATTVIFHRLLLDCGKITLSTPGRTVIAAALGFGYYWLGSYAVTTLIALVDPGFYNVNDANLSQMATQNYPLILFGTVVLAPITEELLYRGLVFGSLFNKSRLLAYTVSTLGFAALHVVSYIGMYEPLHLLLCLLQYIPAGLSLGYAYAKADSILAPIAIHVFINMIAMLARR